MSDVIQSDRDVTRSILWVETLIDDVDAIDGAIAAHRIASTADLRSKLDVAREALRQAHHTLLGVSIGNLDVDLSPAFDAIDKALAIIGRDGHYPFRTSKVR